MIIDTLVLDYTHARAATRHPVILLARPDLLILPMAALLELYWQVKEVRHIEVGDHVKAPIPGFPMMKADAEVTKYEGENSSGEMMFTIKFGDDEVVEHVSQNVLTKATSNRTKAVLMWKKGYSAVKAVGAFSDKKWGAYRKLSTVNTMIPPNIAALKVS